MTDIKLSTDCGTAVCCVKCQTVYPPAAVYCAKCGTKKASDTQTVSQVLDTLIDYPKFIWNGADIKEVKIPFDSIKADGRTNNILHAVACDTGSDPQLCIVQESSRRIPHPSEPITGLTANEMAEILWRDNGKSGPQTSGEIEFASRLGVRNIAFIDRGHMHMQMQNGSLVTKMELRTLISILVRHRISKPIFGYSLAARTDEALLAAFQFDDSQKMPEGQTLTMQLKQLTESDFDVKAITARALKQCSIKPERFGYQSAQTGTKAFTDEVTVKVGAYCNNYLRYWLPEWAAQQKTFDALLAQLPTLYYSKPTGFVTESELMKQTAVLSKLFDIDIQRQTVAVAVGSLIVRVLKPALIHFVKRARLMEIIIGAAPPKNNLKTDELRTAMMFM